MKVYTKSLKNATEQHNKVTKASLNVHLITLMSIKPLTSAHFVMKMNIHQAITVCCVKKTDGESNRIAQDMLQGKIKHKQVRRQGFPKLNPQAYVVRVSTEQCARSALPTDQSHSLFLMK